MAFRFFRKRQKMVIIVMAVLMISFLIGYQGLNALFERRRGRGLEIGTTKYGPLRLMAKFSAKNDLDLLRHMQMTETAYWHLVVANGPQADLAYALLFQEAKAMGVEASKSQVNRFFARRGFSGPEYDAYLTELRQRYSNVTDKLLRSVVTRWLMVRKAFGTGMVASPPSERQLRRLYRDLNEKINLRVIKVPAADFIEKVPQPQAPEIVEQFNAYRDRTRGDYSEENPFGFGYRYPDRVRIQYLFISRDAIERACLPSEKQVMDYYLAHRDELTRQVPIVATAPADQIEGGDAPATAPSTAPATAPSTEPAFRTEQLAYSEARDQVFATLQADMVARAMRDLTDRAERLTEQAPAPEGRANPYTPLRDRLLRAADDVLAREIDVDIDSQPIDQAVARLSDAANVVICYPWGADGEHDLDASVRVSLTGRGITLGEALAKIGEQIKDWPELQWLQCPALGGALFASAGVPMLPVEVGQTQLIDARAFGDDPILSSAATAPRGGQSLSVLAFGSRSLGSGGGGLDAGTEGPRMHVLGEKPGTLLWRLAEARPSETLEEITDPEQLDQAVVARVVSDLKTTRAFALAEERAAEILKLAEKDGVQAAAAKLGVEPLETGLFARKMQVSPGRQLLALAQLTGQMSPQIYIQSALARPQVFLWSHLQDLELPAGQPGEDFMTRAFALVPQEIEPPYPELGCPAVIAVPARSEVLVVQRIDYAPPLQSEYERPGEEAPSGRAQLEAALAQVRYWEAMGAWFTLENIIERTGFKPASDLAPDAEQQEDEEPGADASDQPATDRSP